jgi:hypothetical protein
MKRVWVVHGYNADNGKNTTDHLIPHLKGHFEIAEFDYGDFDLKDVRIHTDELVDRLVDYMEDGDVFVSHSHGCAIISKVIDRGLKVSGIFVHPALHRDWEPPEDYSGRIKVIYHWADYATWSALIVRRFSPFNCVFGRHFWGAMGSLGARSSRPCFENIIGLPGHSAEFHSFEWKTHIVNLLRQL